MPDVRRDLPCNPSAFRYHRWRKSRWLCEPSPGVLHLVGREGCSCFEHHAIHQHEGTRCVHARELADRLRVEAAVLLREARGLTEPARPVRCHEFDHR